MEIKVGDKVRVSKDAPMIYTQNGFNIATKMDFEVDKVEDGCASIKNEDGILTIAYVIPCKYLTKVEDEAKAKYKVGDKVRVLGHALLEGGVYTIIGVEHRERLGWYYQINIHEWYPEIDLEPYTEPTTPKYKKGDRVKICSKNADRFGCVGTILKVYNNGTVDVDFNDYYVGGHLYSVDFIEPYTEPKEQTEAEKKPNVGSIKIPVEVDLTDSYWDSYAADLAKEIALKVANKYNDPKEAADYAVSVAKGVVENLKKK